MNFFTFQLKPYSGKNTINAKNKLRKYRIFFYQKGKYRIKLTKMNK